MKIKNINKQIEADTNRSIINARRRERVQILSTISELWDEMDIIQKKNIIRKLIRKIEVTDNNVHVDFSI